MSTLAGIDIGGTKCAVVLGELNDSGVTILSKVRFATPDTAQHTLEQLVQSLEELQRSSARSIDAIGISCGGPLDSRRGLILSPPNLPGWDNVDVKSPLVDRFRIPVGLQNDANACALAEWKWGAGRGTSNMVFLTFGTGMGAGLILDGRLYTGANDMAGEVGHLRLASDGPMGYGKAGSFEGFCSGGGIARLAQTKAKAWLDAGEYPGYCSDYSQLSAISAETVGRAAAAGDSYALEIWSVAAQQLGHGLAMIVDILNPQRIVIGSIYARQRNLLEAMMWEELRKEALAVSLSVCEIVPAGLGEQVGDYASLSVAMYELENT